MSNVLSKPTAYNFSSAPSFGASNNSTIPISKSTKLRNSSVSPDTKPLGKRIAITPAVKSRNSLSKNHKASLVMTDRMTKTKSPRSSVDKPKPLINPIRKTHLENSKNRKASKKSTKALAGQTTKYNSSKFNIGSRSKALTKRISKASESGAPLANTSSRNGTKALINPIRKTHLEKSKVSKNLMAPKKSTKALTGRTTKYTSSKLNIGSRSKALTKRISKAPESRAPLANTSSRNGTKALNNRIPKTSSTKKRASFALKNAGTKHLKGFNTKSPSTSGKKSTHARVSRRQSRSTIMPYMEPLRRSANALSRLGNIVSRRVRDQFN